MQRIQRSCETSEVLNVLLPGSGLLQGGWLWTVPRAWQWTTSVFRSCWPTRDGGWPTSAATPTAPPGLYEHLLSGNLQLPGLKGACTPHAQTSSVFLTDFRPNSSF